MKHKLYVSKKQFVLVDEREMTAEAVAELNRDLWKAENDARRDEKRTCSLNAPISKDNPNERGDLLPCPKSVIDIEADERKAAIWQLFEALPPNQKQVAEMLFDGLSEADIARKLSVSRVAVLNLKKKLQKKFEEFL